jgi:SAM-dependent methyltransferase
MEKYTPGDAPSVTAFMARRTLASHGRFFREFLRPGDKVLDCGCGPGTITVGIVDCVGMEGLVVGVDANPQQVDAARDQLAGRPNVELHAGSVYALPFGRASFDAVFSHALFEHLADPVRAAQEVFRVLRPGGVVGLRSPDWDGKLAGPPSRELSAALEYYGEMQAGNGGNLRSGKELGVVLGSARFQQVRVRASYECYEPVGVIAEYLARQVEVTRDGGGHAEILRAWAAAEGAFFAQAWCEATARKPRDVE